MARLLVLLVDFDDDDGGLHEVVGIWQLVSGRLMDELTSPLSLTLVFPLMCSKHL
jgi:hypothetical protein